MVTWEVSPDSPGLQGTEGWMGLGQAPGGFWLDFVRAAHMSLTERRDGANGPKLSGSETSLRVGKGEQAGGRINHRKPFEAMSL